MIENNADRMVVFKNVQSKNLQKMTASLFDEESLVEWTRNLLDFVDFIDDMRLILQIIQEKCTKSIGRAIRYVWLNQQKTIRQIEIIWYEVWDFIPDEIDIVVDRYFPIKRGSNSLNFISPLRDFSISCSKMFVDTLYLYKRRKRRI